MAAVVFLAVTVWWGTVDSPAHGQASDLVGGGALRLLTEQQYKSSVSDIFGTDIIVGGGFQPSVRKDGLLAVGDADQAMSATSLERYVLLAQGVAEQAVDPIHRKILFGCPVASQVISRDPCIRKSIGDLGRLLFRRPLSPEELSSQFKVAEVASATRRSNYAGLQASIASMLASPQFLYRWETADANGNEVVRLSPYAIATRLSFFLWNSAPDAELLEAARDGKLESRSGYSAQVDRLLQSPRLEYGVRAFFSDILGFDGYSGLSKDSELYPEFTDKVSNQSREQTLRTLVDLLLVDNGDYRDVFTTRRTMLTPELAKLYRIPLAGNEEWQQYEYSKRDQRGAGILAQASFTALHSQPGRSSPSVRGRALRELILCAEIPDPPGNIDFKLVQDTNDAQLPTVRERLAAHATEPMCAGCHRLMDPVGLGLENFNTAGQWRTHENGKLINVAGELDGISFHDPISLGKAVHDNPAATQCLVKRLFSYAVGRKPTRLERVWLKKEINPDFASSGYQLRSLLREIALSRSFSEIKELRTNQVVQH